MIYIIIGNKGIYDIIFIYIHIKMKKYAHTYM